MHEVPLCVAIAHIAFTSFEREQDKSMLCNANRANKKKTVSINATGCCLGSYFARLWPLASSLFTKHTKKGI